MAELVPAVVRGVARSSPRLFRTALLLGLAQACMFPDYNLPDSGRSRNRCAAQACAGESPAAGGTDATAGLGGNAASGGSAQGGTPPQADGGAETEAGATGGPTAGSGGEAGTSAGTGGGSPSAGAGGTVGGGGTTAGTGGAGEPTQCLSVGQPVTASTYETGHEPGDANDESNATRWCAKNGVLPQWWRVDLEATRVVTEVRMRVEHPERTYRFFVETSLDDLAYTERLRGSATGAVASFELPAVAARYVRVTIDEVSPVSVNGNGTWASFYEFSVMGN